MTSVLKWRQIDKFDGQNIYANSKVIYEIDNFLGGGASGSVYQANDPYCGCNDKSVAVKILNPLGYKCMTSSQMSQCVVLHKGAQYNLKTALTLDHVWWLLYPPTRQVLAAFEDPHRSHELKELPLTKCVELWQFNPLNVETLSEAELDKINVDKQKVVTHNNKTYKLPIVAPKYLKYLKNRQLVCREMHNMARIGCHVNIVDLLEVLELVQESKATLFLVLELVNGGELFDRMKSNLYCSNPEEFAHRYFNQLISGLEYCHKKGIVHRDLKPENLLLSDPSDHAILKIADFGLSAVILSTEYEDCLPITFNSANTYNAAQQDAASTSATNNSTATDKLYTPTTGKNSSGISGNNVSGVSVEVPSLRRLRSVVGSPHYIAPEISDQGDMLGYDGCKVDMWSAGVILYSLFTGALPFGSDLSRCSRFKQFKHFVNNEYQLYLSSSSSHSKDALTLPVWFWPPALSSHQVVSLVVGLLHHDPNQRLTAIDVKKHPWYNSYNTTTTANTNINTAMPLHKNNSNNNFILHKANTPNLCTIEERSLSSGSNHSQQSNISNCTNNTSASHATSVSVNKEGSCKQRRVSQTPVTKSLINTLEEDSFTRLAITAQSASNIAPSVGNAKTAIDPSPMRKKRLNNINDVNNY